MIRRLAKLKRPAIRELVRRIAAASFALAAPFTAHSVIAASTRVSDCRPCTLQLVRGKPAFDFSFNVVTQPGQTERRVQSIDVSRNGAVLQRLLVPNMEPIGPEEQFVFGAIDFNDPIHPCVTLLTSSGAANAYARYWLYDRSRSAFVDLGSFPVLRFDKRTKSIRSHERGGHGGREFEDKWYVLSGDRLLISRIVSQTWDSSVGAYKRVIRERRGDQLDLITQEVVKE